MLSDEVLCLSMILEKVFQFFQKKQNAWWHQTGIYWITVTIIFCAKDLDTGKENHFLFCYLQRIQRMIYTNWIQVAQSLQIGTLKKRKYITPVSFSNPLITYRINNRATSILWSLPFTYMIRYELFFLIKSLLRSPCKQCIFHM